MEVMEENREFLFTVVIPIISDLIDDHNAVELVDLKNQLQPSGSSKNQNYKLFEEEKSQDPLSGLNGMKGSDLGLDEIKLDMEDGLKGADSDPTVHLN
jgi:hypothetical protein